MRSRVWVFLVVIAVVDAALLYALLSDSASEAPPLKRLRRRPAPPAPSAPDARAPGTAPPASAAPLRPSGNAADWHARVAAILKEPTRRLRVAPAEGASEAPSQPSTAPARRPPLLVRPEPRAGVESGRSPPGADSFYLLWPTYTRRVTSPFGMRVNPIPGGHQFQRHDGLDLGAPCGSDVVAAADGVVNFAGYTRAGGYTIRLSHAHGVATAYAHLSELKVRAGDRVVAGDVVALSGDTGQRSTGPHLHFEVSRWGAAQNPLSFRYRYLAEAPSVSGFARCGPSRGPAELVRSPLGKEPTATPGTEAEAESEADSVYDLYLDLIGS